MIETFIQVFWGTLITFTMILFFVEAYRYIKRKTKKETN